MFHASTARDATVGMRRFVEAFAATCNLLDVAVGTTSLHVSPTIAGAPSREPCWYFTWSPTAKRPVGHRGCVREVDFANRLAHRGCSTGAETQLADAQAYKQTGEVRISSLFAAHGNRTMLFSAPSTICLIPRKTVGCTAVQSSTRSAESRSAAVLRPSIFGLMPGCFLPSVCQQYPNCHLCRSKRAPRYTCFCDPHLPGQLEGQYRRCNI